MSWLSTKIRYFFGVQQYRPAGVNLERAHATTAVLSGTHEFLVPCGTLAFSS